MGIVLGWFSHGAGIDDLLRCFPALLSYDPMILFYYKLRLDLEYVHKALIALLIRAVQNWTDGNHRGGGKVY